MSEPNREAEKISQEMARAAQEMSRFVEEISKLAEAWRDSEQVFRAVHDVGAALEQIERARLGRIRNAGLPEEEAALIADASVHRVREDLAHSWGDEPKAPPPAPEEIQEWVQRRKERHRREAS